MQRLLLLCLCSSFALVSAVEFSALAERDQVILGLSEQLAVIKGKGWVKAKLEAEKGRPLSGYLKVDGSAVSYKKTSKGDVEKVDLSSYASVDYGKAKAKSIKDAEKLQKAWDISGALRAYEKAVKESEQHPAALLAVAEAKAIKASYDALFNRLTASKENAKRSTYLQDLTTFLTVTKLKEADSDLTAGIKKAWHEQAKHG